MLHTSKPNIRSLEKPLVIHIIYKLGIGGLESLLVSFINSMLGQRYRHVVVCVTESSAKFATRINRNDIEIISLRKRPGTNFGSLISFWRVLRRLKPDIVHSYNIGTLEYQFVAYFAGVPVHIHAEHGRDIGDPEGRNKRYARLRRLSSRFINAFVAVSDDLARWLYADIGIAKEKIVHISNGVDTELFKPAIGVNRKEIVTGFKKEQFVIAVVGRLAPIKDHKTLIESFALILESWNKTTAKPGLLIVGDGVERINLERQVQSLGIERNCVFLGARNDVAQILNHVDVFALSSIAEGVPITILEAMACEKPVVASRVGGIPDVVVSGKTGFLAQPGSVEEFKKYLLQYIYNESLRNEHGRNGRDYICRNFSIESTCLAYSDLYCRLIEIAGSKAPFS